jgi:hypothetical protein
MAFKLGDFTATNAFYWDSTDLSTYAGTDLGSTPYSIVLTDAAGKTARGFIGAAGAGETLGGELGINVSFDVDASSWLALNCTLAAIAGGQSGKCLEITRTGAIPNSAYQNYTTTPLSCLLKASGYVKSGTSGDEAFSIRHEGVVTFLSGISSGSWVQYMGYKSSKSDCYWYLRKDTATAGTMLFDEVSLKRVTEPPVTGVHIISAYGGSVRAWATIDSGFNPNTITTAVVTKNIWNQLSNYYRRRRSS